MKNQSAVILLWVYTQDRALLTFILLGVAISIMGHGLLKMLGLFEQKRIKSRNEWNFAANETENM
jgi:hypothetical protein